MDFTCQAVYTAEIGYRYIFQYKHNSIQKCSDIIRIPRETESNRAYLVTFMVNRCIFLEIRFTFHSYIYLTKQWTR